MKILSLLLLAGSLFAQVSTDLVWRSPGAIQGTYSYAVIDNTGPVSPVDAWKTSLEAAIQNSFWSSSEMVSHFNQERVKIYNQNFEDWKTMVLAGKIDNQNPPKPQAAYEVVKAASGFFYPELGQSAVCPARTDIPADYSKPNVTVLPEPENVRSVPAGDTMPVGYIASAPDGSKWQKKSSVTPFGVAYFYERLK